MGRKATATIPIQPETKKLVREQKKDGETYDLFIRELVTGEREV